MVGGGSGERARRELGKTPMLERSDESSMRAVITSSVSDCAGSVYAVQSRDIDLPQAIEKPKKHGAPKAEQEPHEGPKCGQGRKRGRRHPELNMYMLPRDSTPQPHEPCYIFQRELQNIQNGSAEGTKLVTEELNTNTGPQSGTGMDSCEGETSADIECGRCPQCGAHMESGEGETSAYIEGGCSCSDDQLEEPIQFADQGPLFCYTCLGRIIEESPSGESEASNSLPCTDTSSSEESFPGSEVPTSLASGDDAVVPELK